MAEFLRERGLELSEEKTQIVQIEEGFDFLGQNIRKYNGKMLIKPSKKNVQAFLANVREVIKTNKQATAGVLIRQLNPKIRGWANYHRHVVSKEVFHSTDHAIYQALWQWAKRRHPSKSRRWVKNKYFHTVGNHNWTFSGTTTDLGKLTVRHLVRAADVPIQRHTKVRGETNPYDPTWETYFERRLDVKMEANLQGRKRLLYLWTRQQGICPHCRLKITKLTGWHSHHKVWRSKGGSDAADNRVLLHPECHRQVHRLELDGGSRVP